MNLRYIISFLGILLFNLYAFCELKITFTRPQNGAQDIPINTKIYVDFNEELDELTINNYSITLMDEEAEIPGKIKYLPELKRLVFKPYYNLEKGKNYKLIIYSGITSISGDTLKRDIIINFDTGKKRDITLPQIIKTIPAMGEKDVDINTHITIFFSEAIKANSLKNAVKIMGGKRKIRFKYSYYANGFKLIIIPETPLEEGTHYKIILSKNICDLSGNPLGGSSALEFDTIILDKTPPDFLASYPKNNQRNLELTTEIIIKVSEELDPSSLNNITLINKDENKIEKIDIKYNPTAFEIKLIPKEKLKESSHYIVDINGVKDPAGNVMKTKKIEFFTKKLPDTIPPKLLEIIPKNNEKDVPLKTQISLRFSEAIDRTTLYDSIFLSDGDKMVKINIKQDATKKIISIIPKNPLEPNKHYVLTVKKYICDINGNRMEEGVISNFFTVYVPEKEAKIQSTNLDPIDKAKIDNIISEITGVPISVPIKEIEKIKPPKDIIPLKIIDYFPGNNFKGVALDTRISFIFNKDINEKTLTDKNITILQDKKSIQFTIIYDYEFKKLTLIPNNLLMPKKKVVVKLSDKIKDIDGNPLTPFKLEFITGKTLDSDIDIVLKEKSLPPTPEINVKNIKKITEDIKEINTDIDFYNNDVYKENFTRNEWAIYLVNRLHKIFIPDYSLKINNNFSKPSRYELALIINRILNKILDSDYEHMFRNKRGIAKILLLTQAVIEFERELTIMGSPIKKFIKLIKKRGIPFERIKEDMDNGIIKGKS